MMTLSFMDGLPSNKSPIFIRSEHDTSKSYLSREAALNRASNRNKGHPMDVIGELFLALSGKGFDGHETNLPLITEK